MSTAATWAERAADVGAKPFPPERGVEMLAAVWSNGRPALDEGSLRRLAARLRFAAVGAGRQLIFRDEPGEFLAIVLDGSVAVERRVDAQAGQAMRPIEAGAGDVVGEVALLDSGPRLFDCTTRTPCVVAVLESSALAAIMQDDAPLALVLLALLARKLSLRLRQTSTRLSALLGDG